MLKGYLVSVNGMVSFTLSLVQNKSMGDAWAHNYHTVPVSLKKRGEKLLFNFVYKLNTKNIQVPVLFKISDAWKSKLKLIAYRHWTMGAVDWFSQIKNRQLHLEFQPFLENFCFSFQNVHKKPLTLLRSDLMWLF